MSELKPCPFCGATDVEAVAEQVDAVSWNGEIECIDCEMRVSSEVCERTPELAIIEVTEVWNRRTKMSETKTLEDALPEEIKRVTELLPIYASCGPVATIALAMMRSSLDRATRALASGDILEMVECLVDLQGYSA